MGETGSWGVDRVIGCFELLGGLPIEGNDVCLQDHDRKLFQQASGNILGLHVISESENYYLAWPIVFFGFESSFSCL